MPDDATPQAAVATTAATQPAPQAVPAEPSVSPAPAAPAADVAVTAPSLEQVQQELQTLKQRYSASSEEAIRLYRENEVLKAAKAVPSAAAQAPSYTPEQLETWKEQWLVEAATKPDRAQEAAHQVRLIDAELRKLELSHFAGKQTASYAFEQLKTVAAPILNQYKDEFQPGSALLNDTNVLYMQALAAGMPEGEMTKATVALLALAKSGKFGVQASQQATKSLNQAIKSAAAAGSGAANQNAAPGPDFAKMSPKTPEGRKAFEEYRRSLGVG